MNIVIADDHGIVRDGIRWMLVNEPSIEIVGEAGDGQALLDLVDDLHPDGVLLDIRMAGMNGLDALVELKEKHPEIPVLMLTMYDEPEMVAGAIARGADGYLLKGAARDELIRAIHIIGEGGAYLQGHLTAPLMQVVATEGRDAMPVLDAQEREILQMAAGGKGNRQIAADIGITEAAVKAKLHHLFERLGAHGRAEAVAMAMRLGIIV